MPIQIGPLQIRRSALIAATPDRVWQEFTSFERLEAWFGTGHKLVRFEPRLGGQVELSIDDGRSFGGPILVFEPGRELTFEDNWKGEAALPLPNFITIRLTALYDGTHVELFEHGFERFVVEAGNLLEGLESGWHSRHLEGLKRVVEG